MPAIIEDPHEPSDESRASWVRLDWFAGLPLASGSAAIAVACALKALLPR